MGRGGLSKITDFFGWGKLPKSSVDNAQGIGHNLAVRGNVVCRVWKMHKALWKER